MKRTLLLLGVMLSCPILASCGMSNNCGCNFILDLWQNLSREGDVASPTLSDTPLPSCHEMLFTKQSLSGLFLFS
jgi:hypothetical protein